MASTEIIVLVTKSRDAAHDALRELRRLKREGWIDLTCYTLFGADEQHALRIHESCDQAEAIRRACPEVFIEAVHRELQAGDSALLVVVEQPYAERVAEEFASRGRALRRPMQGAPCDAALRVSIGGIKSKLAWLEELLDRESDKAAWAYGEEREKLETAIRAARTELNAEREHLQARLPALRDQLEAHLREIAGKTETEGASAEEIEREIAAINEDLALRILDRLDELSTLASELRERAARASPEEEAAIGIPLCEIEVQMRKHRGELTATLASSASLLRHCVERVGGHRLQSHVQRLEQRHALLKADVQCVERGDARESLTATGGY